MPHGTNSELREGVNRLYVHACRSPLVHCVPTRERYAWVCSLQYACDVKKIRFFLSSPLYIRCFTKLSFHDHWVYSQHRTAFFSSDVALMFSSKMESRNI